MSSWSVAVQAFKVELRTAGVAQGRRIGMGSQNGSVSRYIVSHKLAEDRPSRRGVSQVGGRVMGVSAIAETARATERVQELLIALKRREFGKHPGVVRGANRCIDWHFGSCRRAVISGCCGGPIHESSILASLSLSRPCCDLLLLLETNRWAP
jgi:hypothetical protein